ncbi:hypothetical protein [Streptomyces sp. NRRL S-31]|uniref:hypothetical protein n=1 Tax=Streptomyces sp. NRRL S-31 TaxID=1463898 RepID=UPI0004CC644C|nr:hypothetical protein [Streptomyces sp. NRRL S-31]
MTRNWLFCTLAGQAWADQEAALAPRLPDGVLGALAAIRTERGGHWFFQPLQDGTPGTELWVGADDAHGALSALLTEADRAGVRLLHRPEPRRAAATDELATRSSELALALAGSGGLTQEDRLALAVLHLRHAAGFLPDPERSAFLFLCWQYWAASLDAEQRLAVGRRAADRAGELIDASDLLAMDARVAAAWQDYLSELGSLVAGDGAAEHPGKYLLFEHLRLTHLRLGVPARAEALAALAVRGAPEAAVVPGDTVLQSA